MKQDELGSLVAQLIEQQKEFQESIREQQKEFQNDMKEELVAIKKENNALKKNYLLAEEEARTNAKARAEAAELAVYNEYEYNLINAINVAIKASEDVYLAIHEAEYAVQIAKRTSIISLVCIVALIVFIIVRTFIVQ